MEAQLERRLTAWTLAAVGGASVIIAWLVSDGLPVRGAAYRLMGWGLAALIGAVYTGQSVRQSVGMALMWVPVTRTAISILNNLEGLTTSGQVLPAYSQYQLSSFYIFSIMRNVGYVGAGFLLWSGWRPRDSMTMLARRLRSTGAPVVRRSEWHDMRIGIALFPVLLLVAYLFNVLATNHLPQLINSDESSIWRNMTPWHAIMISAAASLGEEIVYRLFLMTSLAAILARGRLPGHLPWAGAVVGQAIFFGLAHASYANWLHVLEATLFGLLAGVAALRFGIWVPVVLHFLIDIYAIGGHAGNLVWWWLLVLGLVGMSLYTLWRAAAFVYGSRGTKN